MKFYILKQNLVYLLTFMTCLAISGAIAWKAYEWQRTANYESFRHTSRENFLFIKKTLEWHEEFVVSIANYFLSSKNISAQEFQSYTNFNIHLPNGFHMLGWIAAEDGKLPVIKYINAEDGYAHNNITDIQKDARLSKYLNTARRSGKATYFLDKGLFSRSNHDHLLIIDPAFSDVRDQSSVIGYAFSVVDVNNLIMKSLGELNPYIHLEIITNGELDGETVLFNSTVSPVENTFYQRKKNIELTGLTLDFNFTVTNSFLQEHSLTKTYILFIMVYLALCTMAILYFRQLNSHILKIREAQRRAEESNRLKNDFLATMSHEIRSPMSGVLGMAELLLGTNLTTDQRGYTETILSSGEVLLNIIEDILDVSKIEANKMKIDPIPVNMMDLVDDVCALYTCKSQEKAVELAVRYLPGSEPFVYADPVRVRQVLGNLVNNAIKFTEKGHITVSVREDHRADVAEDMVRLIFSVEDTGIGISREAQARIFEQFMQADSSTTRNYGGTGLGLTISRKLVELMDGQIAVISEPGVGSVFSFSLTLRRNASERVPVPMPPVLKGVKILIVDDFSVIGDVLCENLGMIGMECHWEPDPLRVLSLLKKAKEEDRPYDIAILDFLMPGLNGESLARQIKGDSDLKDTCLIMLTAAGNPSTENTLVRECFSAYLAKPIRITPFIEKLAVVWNMYQNGYRDSLIRTDSFPLVLREKQEFTPLNGISILLAEDSRINQAFALDVLEQLQCRVRIVTNGEDAINAIRDEEFDIILMDCQMPVMDGFEATRQIVALKQAGIVNPDLPIIALTANAMEGDREKCLLAGMDDYLSKPVRAKELREKVYHWLKIDERMPAHSEPTLIPADAAFTGIQAQAQIIDPESVQLSRHILKDKYDHMLGFFFEDTQTYIDEIIHAFETGHFNEGIRPAHTIKSTSLRMGAVHLSNCARELEQVLKSHENDNLSTVDIETLDSHLTHLKGAFDQTKPLLSAGAGTGA